MKLIVKDYLSQAGQWPQSGRYILAQFDQDSIIVYQAYNAAIGHFAATHRYFGGEFSFHRMSWIKTSFLWMMYRSGWGTKANQEVTLAVWLKRNAFDTILKQAVHSHFVPELYSSEAEWRVALKNSSVRLQWDPDRDPTGAEVSRRAVQLGLRDNTLVQYARDWIDDIEDISKFVLEQSLQVNTHRYEKLLIPFQAVYPLFDTDATSNIGINI